MFRVNNARPFLQAFFLLTRLGDRADMKFSPIMFSLKVSHFSSRFFVAALQFAPEFFSHFSFNHTHYSRIPLHRLYHLIVDMIQIASSSMAIFLDEHRNRLVLQFFSSGQSEEVVFRHLIILSCPMEEDMGQIVPQTYVSIASQDFRHIVQLFDGYLVHVTLTDLQVKFADAYNREIIFTKEEDQCEIVGVKEGDEIKFLITLHPVEFFYNMTYNAARVWFYKTTHSGSMIIAPMGDFARYMIHFPPT